ncbi:hypothetical protein MsAm2_00610 [Methanolapillus ohkumae]|uniref:Metal-binding protein n=2 Tax=Methanolapillus ohkumae TaxID=3028298 RepID=A0AA96ZW87_9EURY|nr:hypothetical protein MsAm2_00610 [Methanosarcinaceae archaeon Am2]
MKKRFEKIGYVQEFNEYYKLDISPVHVHKSKNEHKQAVSVLSNALAVVVEEQSRYHTKPGKKENEREKER